MRPIPDYPGYFATDEGHIFDMVEGSPTKGQICKEWSGSGRYMRAYLLNEDGYRDTVRVHILVCSAYYEKPHWSSFALHRDGDRWNNLPENLYWGDEEQNRQDAKRHGTIPKLYGMRNHVTHFSAKTIAQIRKEYAAGGITQHALAEKYGCHQVYVSELTLGKKRTHDNLDT